MAIEIKTETTTTTTVVTNHEAILTIEQLREALGLPEAAKLRAYDEYGEQCDVAELCIEWTDEKVTRS